MFFLKPKFVIPIAIIIGLLATLGVSRYLEREREELRKPKIPIRPVVVARMALPLGTKLDEKNLKISEWPENIVPGGAFTDISKTIGRVANTPIAEGEPVLETKLAPEGSASGFSSLIPPGMRAMTVEVDVSSGVSGFILPNARVDVLVTVNAGTRRSESSTRIILEDIQVLAVDQNYQAKEDDPITVQSVTLLVDPNQAEKLALASTEGKLRLTLRNTSDRATNNTGGIRLNDLMSNRPAAQPRVSKPRVTQPKEEKKEEKTIEILRSNERSEVKFKTDGKDK
ncbi:Flp pilus assembly protein CpaB [candidate division KSB1 bacterium]|nr:Flp pilus assembly protein CpaB [candidate division KSB1 bacterium]